MALATWTAGFAPSIEGGAARALEAVRSPMVPSTGTLEGRGMLAALAAAVMLKRESWCPERKRSWSQRKM